MHDLRWWKKGLNSLERFRFFFFTWRKPIDDEINRNKLRIFVVQSNDSKTKSNQEMKRRKKVLLLKAKVIIYGTHKVYLVVVMVLCHFSKMNKSFYIVDLPAMNIRNGTRPRSKINTGQFVKSSSVPRRHWTVFRLEPSAITHPHTHIYNILYWCNSLDLIN